MPPRLAGTADHSPEALAAHRKLEREFFHLVGVDQRLCWVGKLPPYSVPDYFFLSVADMARFGLQGVEAPPDYRHTDTSRFSPDIRYIELRLPRR